MGIHLNKVRIVAIIATTLAIGIGSWGVYATANTKQASSAPSASTSSMPSTTPQAQPPETNTPVPKPLVITQPIDSSSSQTSINASSNCAKHRTSSSDGSAASEDIAVTCTGNSQNGTTSVDIKSSTSQSGSSSISNTSTTTIDIQN